MNNTLYVKDAAGTYLPATDDQITTTALSLIDKAMRRGPVLKNYRDVKQFLTLRLSRLEHEVFGMILLDTRLQVIEVVDLFRGTIDSAAVYPREVVKAVLSHNAHSVILFHNHPSGLAEPSEADRHLTSRLKDALALIDVRVLDHLVIGHDFVESFAERGMI